MLAKVIFTAVTGIILINIIKECKTEYAFPATIALTVLLLGFMANEAKNIFEMIHDFEKETAVSKDFVSDVLKLISISYAKKFTSELCSDFGYRSIADKIDICAKFAASTVMIPKLYTLYVNIINLL